ncbi:hypothetical protein HELRODRAFT_184944 [Helobdella robusta]|uniref:Fascin n=1 Tax=Helobdella robusta TaxID=6412 RepID=T1FM71_HELRO|nr:hypothetical protein HELRODRAFT_184944 [Helobdella robusta]ESO06587.1 hypothetical protein HELRODRAFT_184944 [Helobdella robusta]
MNNRSSPQTQIWKVGLVNHQLKYLTAETFGFKINASGASLRKKQLWTVEQDANEEDTIYIKSHLGRYLAGDKKGNATCDSESKGDAQKFVIYYCPDQSGRWAICNRSTGLYLGGTDEIVQCHEKQPGAAEWWYAHLAVHPQINLRNYGRNKYARLNSKTNHLQVDEITPWGADALITIEFIEGRYGVKTCDDRYLHFNGSLVDQPSSDTLFTIELKSGMYCGLALKDHSGKYLTAIGKDAVVQSKNKSAGKDELFSIEDSQAQVYFIAHNGKMVSLKQGIDMSANQDTDINDLSDKETFQIEFDLRTHQWRVKTCENNYWCFDPASNGIQCIGNGNNPNELFTVDWLPNGAITLRASNGKFVSAKMNGSLYAQSDSVSEKEHFYARIINRPILVLKSEFGFVGFRTQNNPRYECNKTIHDIIFVEHKPAKKCGEYYFKGHNGRYWSIDGEGNVNADSSEPHPFIIELRKYTKMAIKAANGCYLIGEQNGIISAKGKDVQKAVMWEY